jgi:hypothetical protein
MTLLAEIPPEPLIQLLEAIKASEIDKYIKLYAFWKRPFEV